VQFGFESGSERVLAYLKQGTVTVEQNRRAIEVCKKHGLSVFGSFIVGSPNETRGDIMATLDFIRNSRIDGGTVYPLIPFPGTEVWRHARERGLVSDHMDWSKLDMEFYNPEQSITLTDKIDGKEFQELYTEIQRELATLLIGCFSGIPPRIHSRVSNVLDSQPKIFGLA
ncbi:MAG: radical SAM protein, partial [Candidatus Bathyarchaeia archaeon]